MEFMVITLFFKISLFLLLQAPCASSLQIQVQYSHEKAIEVQLSDLPRKLRVTAEVTVKQHGAPDTMSSNKQQNEPVHSGKTKNKEKGVMHGSKGTWREWVEGTDTSQYFTMDYSHVKRRRPIHNKALPVGP
ncbi:protein GOLVEN 6-like isoform X1 [Mangifera indica]|uniref:protein GOLVEN 6-like isoform X1 n=1 Tax=Mangifera indica TaxID=29780 RepID=UPI001CFA3018|nr:protein GOLVEN 6-like isoform X1 [Mangifera indica]